MRAFFIILALIFSCSCVSPLAAQEPYSSVQVLLDGIVSADWNSEPSALVAPTANLPLPPTQAASLLQEFRCRSITFKQFTRTQRTVNVFIYNFPDARCAFGAYSTCRLGSSNVVVRGDASSEDDSAICFLKGNNFITITTTAEDDELSKQFASRIADELNIKIADRADPPSALHALPILDRMPGSERIFMGPIAARKYMAIPFIQMLNVEKSRGAVYADYQFPHPDADRIKTMVIEYGDPKVASQVYNDYASAIGSIHKSKPLSTTAQLSRMKDSFMLCMQTRSRVCILAGARRKISTVVLARQLAL